MRVRSSVFLGIFLTLTFAPLTVHATSRKCNPPSKLIVEEVRPQVDGLLIEPQSTCFMDSLIVANEGPVKLTLFDRTGLPAIELLPNNDGVLLRKQSGEWERQKRLVYRYVLYQISTGHGIASPERFSKWSITGRLGDQTVEIIGRTVKQIPWWQQRIGGVSLLTVFIGAVMGTMVILAIRIRRLL